MKKLFTILLLFVVTLTHSLSAQTIGNPDNDDIYGTWKTYDGDQILYMNYGEWGANNKRNPDTFIRQNSEETITGEFYCEEKWIYVQKKDEKYRLMFYLKGTTMVVYKPDGEKSAGEVWLFLKVSNYGLSY
jgi:hypothetical protein|tara:strand:- start:891 stop:1283 length:393 start_codon:yes stop_codon:yes gene_type:complete